MCRLCIVFPARCSHPPDSTRDVFLAAPLRLVCSISRRGNCHERPKPALGVQRTRGELLRSAQTRADQAADLSRQRCRARRRVRLYRDVVQPRTSPWFNWRPIACSVRAAPCATRGISVYATLGRSVQSGYAVCAYLQTRQAFAPCPSDDGPTGCCAQYACVQSAQVCGRCSSPWSGRRRWAISTGTRRTCSAARRLRMRVLSR